MLGLGVEGCSAVYEVGCLSPVTTAKLLCIISKPCFTVVSYYLRPCFPNPALLQAGHSTHPKALNAPSPEFMLRLFTVVEFLREDPKISMGLQFTIRLKRFQNFVGFGV